LSRLKEAQRMQCDRLWRGGRLATFAQDRGGGLIEDGALAATDGRIVFVGARAQLPAQLRPPRNLTSRVDWSRRA
jgi:imidazolonepropionase